MMGIMKKKSMIFTIFRFTNGDIGFIIDITKLNMTLCLVNKTEAAEEITVID